MYTVQSNVKKIKKNKEGLWFVAKGRTDRHHTNLFYKYNNCIIDLSIESVRL